MPELLDPPTIPQEAQTVSTAIPEQAVGSLLANISVNGQPQQPKAKAPSPAPEPVKEPEPKEPEPKTVTAKEPEPKVEPVKEPPKAEPKKSLDDNIVALRKSHEEAAKARDTFKAETEQLRTELTQLRSASSDATVFKDRAEKAEQELVMLRQQLRTVAVERDPDFQREYDGNIQARTGEMLNLALSTGTAQEVFKSAIQSGDEDALQSIRDNLKPQQQRAWDAHFQAIEDLKFKRRQAVDQSEMTWQQLEAQRAEQQKQAMEANRVMNLRMAEGAVEKVWQDIPALQEADPAIRIGLTNAVKAMVTDYSKEQLVNELVMGQMRGQIAAAQIETNKTLQATVAEKDAKLAELEKKIAEQDEFIKAQSAGFRTGDYQRSPASENGTTKPHSLLSDVRVHIPGMAGNGR